MVFTATAPLPRQQAGPVGTCPGLMKMRSHRHGYSTRRGPGPRTQTAHSHSGPPERRLGAQPGPGPWLSV